MKSIILMTALASSMALLSNFARAEHVSMHDVEMLEERIPEKESSSKTHVSHGHGHGHGHGGGWHGGGWERGGWNGGGWNGWGRERGRHHRHHYSR